MRKTDNIIHYNMATVGGFFAGFTVSNLLDLFGNAQTLNLLSIVRDFFICDYPLMALRIVGAVVYLLGMSLSVIIPRCTKIRTDILSIVVDAVCLIILTLLPENLNIFIRVYPVFFATAFQWTVFDKIEGYVSATIFSTNNYRQFTTSLLAYAFDRDKALLSKARVFGFTLLYFHIGVALACALSMFMGKLSALPALLLLIPAAVLIKQKTNKEIETYE
ncbi:MAG: DUF1275 domain-containing protein [Ruminococcus sp.]|nr:DUF1275 domain-containing protein [Ruminococcus sp.]